MAKRTVTPIRFRGSPRLVDGLAPLTLQQALTTSVSLELKMPSWAPRTSALNVQLEPVGISNTRLRFSLPESTPPGTYEGAVQIENQSYPITVEVIPHHYLIILPRQLSLQLSSNKREATVDLTLANSGNVACEIAKAHAFGVFDVGGLERSIGAALRDSAAKGRGRLDHLIDEAADNHGGLVRVNVSDGAGNIEPGELRNIRVTLRFSDRLKQGHTYSGTWPLFNLKYYVRVNVMSSNSSGADRTTEEPS